MRFVQRWAIVLTVVVSGAACDRPPITPNGVVGAFGDVGLAPGSFGYPRAIAADPDGTVLVVDKAGRIQRFDQDGNYQSEWRMPQIRQGKPVGLTVAPDGRVLVADTHYHRVLCFDRSGKLLDEFGTEGEGDGQFLLPTDVAVDARGYLYVSEYQGNDRITKWSPAFEFVTSFGAEPIDGRRLRRPAGIEIDDEQTLWVADACNHRLVRFSLDGKLLSTCGEYGRAPGQLRYPYDITLAPDGTLMVCEYGGDRLQWFSKDGRSLCTWGRSGRALGELSGPWGATYGKNGLIYVVDSLNSRVQIVRP